jgi:putative flippase GtrA
MLHEERVRIVSTKLSGVDWQRWLRFLCGGATNTLVTYVLYLGLIRLMGYQAAYLIAYTFGILLAYWLNATFVFKVKLSWKGLFKYPVIYLVQYIVAAALLEVLVRLAGVPPAIGPLLVTVILLPLTYLMNKLVLKGSRVTPGN